MRFIVVCLFAFVVFFVGCNPQTPSNTENTKPHALATTSMLADLVQNIAGDTINVEYLMGAGIDPHTHEPSPGDLKKIHQAKIILYHGLHFESRIEPILKKMPSEAVTVINASEKFPREKLVAVADEEYDPHVWFDISLWENAAKHVSETLIAKFPSNKDTYEKNLANYLKELQELSEFVTKRVAEVDEKSRVLVTVHDAFSYFARGYGFRVRGLQGVTTEAKISTNDITKLAQFIVDNKIKMIFPEAAIPAKVMVSIQNAVTAKDKDLKVQIGETLFADTIGESGSTEGSYIGMYKFNVNTIVDGLK